MSHEAIDWAFAFSIVAFSEGDEECGGGSEQPQKSQVCSRLIETPDRREIFESSIEETADETDETRTGNDLAPLDEPSVSLVEIEPGMAVLFADKAPTDLDFVPFATMTTQARHELTDKLSVAAGFSNVAVQGAQGTFSAQGLVRLAPQTLEALKIAKPMTSGGWNLGSIVGNNGQIAASVRWAPATGMQSVGMMAALGPAAALLHCSCNSHPSLVGFTKISR
ncbi:MAG: hypothetical protein ACSHW9_03250 [Salinibacterium amurskyense]